MPRTSILFILLLTFPSLLTAQQDSSFSLEQSLRYAMENSPLVSNARLDVEIARKKVQETTAFGLPQVNGQVSFQNFIDIPTQVIPANAFNPQASPDELVAVQFGTDYNASASITANQLIFDGAYIVGLQAARTYKELSTESLARTESAVREQVSQSYYTAVIMQANLDILQSSLNNIQQLRKEMQAIFDAGMAEEQDVEQLHLTEAGIENMISRTQRQAAVALDLLKINMGMPLSEQLVLADDAEELTSSAETLNSDSTFTPTSHYDYRLALANAELMRLNLKKEKFAYLPSLGAFITHQQSAFRNDFNFFKDLPWYPSTIWGINLQVPIFDSGLKGSRIAQARMEHEKSMNMAKLAESQLTLQASAKRADLISAAERLNNEKENQALASSIYNKTLIKYREGLATSLELNQAQTQLLNTQGAYINTVLEVLNARIAYQRAIGN